MMDPNYRIYQDDPDKIPPEDKARLDGYLKARTEADEIADLKAQLRRHGRHALYPEKDDR